jgi:hypothetical protein
LYVPTCDAAQSISIDIDDTNREYPDVDVLFVIDMSRTMRETGLDTANPTLTILEIVSEAVQDAASALYDAYDEYDAEIKIGFVAYYGEHGTDSDGDGTVSPSEFNNFVDLSPTTDSGTFLSELIAKADSLIATEPPGGTPMYAGLHQAYLELISIDDSANPHTQYVILFSDGDITNTYSDLTNTIGLPYYNADGIESDDYMYGLTYLTDLMKSGSGEIYTPVEIFTATLSDPGCATKQMAHWSNMDCADYGSSCSGKTAEGNVSCDVPESGVQYSYDATTAAGLAEMYEQIVDSILNITFTTTEDSVTASTTVSSGNNKTISLPSTFACDGEEENGVALKANFNGGGTITISGATADICEP